ncbi:MAG: hypothetical protein R3B06_07825 [Kofleriaceae bacterium]
MSRAIRRALVVAAVALGATLAPAGATAQAPPPSPTLVLITTSPLLRDAVATGLGPWQIPLVVLPQSADDAATLARTYRASFVAIDHQDSLELFDTSAGTAQYRAMPHPVDEPGAAALALTIKTWMRLGPALPPPPDASPPDASSPDASPPDASPPAPPPRPLEVPRGPALPRRPALQVGAMIGLGFRGAEGGFEAGPRVVAQAEATYRRVDGLVVADLGPAVTATATPAVTWSQMSVAVRGGHTFVLSPAWAVRPSAGAAAVRGDASGIQGASGKLVHKIAWQLGIEGAVDLRWRRGRWRVSTTAGVTAIPAGRELRGTLNLTVPAHVEPWLVVGAGLEVW